MSDLEARLTAALNETLRCLPAYPVQFLGYHLRCNAHRPPWAQTDSAPGARLDAALASYLEEHRLEQVLRDALRALLSEADRSAASLAELLLRTSPPLYDELPLAAVFPAHSEFDSEAAAAVEVGLSVVRFDLDDHVTLHGDAPVPCSGLWRGFMLSAERYSQLHAEMQACGVHLVTPPDAYERVLYYPLSFSALRPLSPRATWVPLPGHQPGELAARSSFVHATEEARGWGCEHVMLKDYVKAAKEQPRFFKVPVEESSEYAAELVAVRGSRFFRGVVFKEWMQLAIYPGGVFNEWRLWFGRGELLSLQPNSFQSDSATHPPSASIEAARVAARHLGSPLLAIDLAECDDETWVCLEANDGGASGPAPAQSLIELWTQLHACFRAS